MDVAIARHLLGNNEVLARPLRGRRRPILSVVAVARQPAQRRQEVPVQLLRESRRPTSLAVAVARHLLDNNEVPARLLHGVRQLIPLAIVFAQHLRQQRQEVPARLLSGVRRPNTFGRPCCLASPLRQRSPRAASAQGEAAYSIGCCRRSASCPATPTGLARLLRRARRSNTYGRRLRPASPRQQ